MKSNNKQIIELGDFMKEIIRPSTIRIILVLLIAILLLLKINNSNDTVKPKSATLVFNNIGCVRYG